MGPPADPAIAVVPKRECGMGKMPPPASTRLFEYRPRERHSNAWAFSDPGGYPQGKSLSGAATVASNDIKASGEFGLAVAWQRPRGAHVGHVGGVDESGVDRRENLSGVFVRILGQSQAGEPESRV